MAEKGASASVFEFNIDKIADDIFSPELSSNQSSQMNQGLTYSPVLSVGSQGVKSTPVSKIDQNQTPKDFLDTGFIDDEGGIYTSNAIVDAPIPIMIIGGVVMLMLYLMKKKKR